MSWLDDLFGKQIRVAGVDVVQRKNLNFVNASVVDNSDTGATDVTVAGSTPVGDQFKNAMSAQSNSSVTAYPTGSANAIGSYSAFVRTAIADHDSIRFFGAVSEPTPSPGIQGRVTNLTAFILDLYPLAGTNIFVDGVDQTVDTPIEVAPGASVFWMLDDNGDWHVTV